jgi:hypothetical protein
MHAADVVRSRGGREKIRSPMDFDGELLPERLRQTNAMMRGERRTQARSASFSSASTSMA